MGSLLSDKYPTHKIKITQVPGAPTPRTLNVIDQLLVVMPEKPRAALWRKLPQGNRLKGLLRKKQPGRVPAVDTRLNNKRQTAVHLGFMTANSEPFEQLTFARKMVAAAGTEKPGSLGIWMLGFDDAVAGKLAEYMAAAALAAGFPLAEFKAEPRPPGIKSIRLVGLAERIDLGRIVAEAEGNNLARWLTALPPNKLDANEYVGMLKELSEANGWQFRKFGVRELEKLGAGAFLAVAQGNANGDAAIVRIRYRPDKASAPPALSLVGKGIIFDTGGTNLKPFVSMLDMHIDMGGSAVAVGTLLALSKLKQPHAVDCWLAITENRIGPTAYKSQDVVTAANGKTIQTIHTDAEGRMALADALVLACREKPVLLIDYATLTGACINAVTSRYSGVFTNRPDWHPVLKRTGRDSGERVWPLPAGKEFLSDLKSDTADLKQCAPNASGDHILASSFLNEFVDPEVPWLHIDLSACQRKGGLAHVPTDTTGFGIRFSTHLIIDKQALGDADWK